MIQRGTKIQSMLLEGTQRVGCHSHQLSKRIPEAVLAWEEGEVVAILAWGEEEEAVAMLAYCPVTAPDSELEPVWVSIPLVCYQGLLVEVQGVSLST